MAHLPLTIACGNYDRTKAIIDGSGQDTERSSVLDIVRGSRWPSKYPARTLGHPYLDRWRGREAELAGDSRARQEYQNDVARGVIPPLPVWAVGPVLRRHGPRRPAGLNPPDQLARRHHHQEAG